MKNKRFFALFLSLALVLCMGTTAFAASSTTATVPVTLTVDNQYRAVNVTVPASLPVYVINGTVVVADNAKIINNSKTSAIQVTNVSVTDGAYKVGSYDNFSGSKTIALKINGCTTKGAGNISLANGAFPVIKAEASQSLIYFAKISGDAPNAKDVNAANVVHRPVSNHRNCGQAPLVSVPARPDAKGGGGADRHRPEHLHPL